jgi:hypothetical protein
MVQSRVAEVDIDASGSQVVCRADDELRAAAPAVDGHAAKAVRGYAGALEWTRDSEEGAGSLPHHPASATFPMRKLTD